MKPIRDLLKHSSIYAIGQILTRLASVLLLPLYTFCLTPADYGITAILDLTAGILSLMIGGGMVMAITRFHFDQDSEEHHDRLWWTGLTYLLCASGFALLPMWLGRQWLSDVTLGEEISEGSWFFTLTLATILIQVVGQLVDAYLRVLKWSGVFVLISLGRLLLNVGLNVWFLVGLKRGVEGLLMGNLIASAVHTTILLAVFARTRGGYRFDPALAKGMLHFSLPIVVTALLAMLMHEADRYFLRVFVSMDEVGIYSLAHKIGFAVNTLVLLPFSSVWYVAIYDIERMKDADRVFGHIFRLVVGGVGLLLLGASLTVHPVLPLLTPDAYGEAIDLISVILLGFFMFGLQMQFEVPALLQKRTGLLVPGSILGVIVNVLGNYLFVPMYGSWGAAWVGVVTYIAFSFTTLLTCRTVRRIPYEWGASFVTFVGLCLTYIAIRYGVFPSVGFVAELAVSIGVCAVWAVVLFRRDGMEWWMSRKAPRQTHSAETAPETIRNGSGADSGRELVEVG